MRKLKTQAIVPMRWVEYSFSASCLFVLAELINGVVDLYHVLLIFASMWTVMMMGLLQEVSAFYLRQLGAGGVSRLEFLLPHLIGWVPYIVMWFEAFDRFRLDMSKIKPASPPAWVTGFYSVLFLLFTSFGFNQFVEMWRLYGVRTDEEVARIATRAEYVYVSLSLLAKTSCAAFLLSGLLASSGAAHY